MKTTKKTLFGLGTLMVALVCCLDTASAQTLAASPAALTFNTTPGVTPAAQSFTISSSSPATVNLTSFPAWIQLSATTGATPLVVTVSIGAGAPSNGGGGFITVNSASATLSVPVNLNVSGTAGVLTATPNPVNFTFAPGSQVASTLPVTITSSSSTVTSFTISPPSTTDGFQWLTIGNPGNGVLTGSPNPSGSITVTVSPGQLPTTGTSFTGSVTVTGGGQSTTIPVNVTITSTPALSVTPTSLSFGFQTNTAQPAAQLLTISTSTGAPVTITATTKISSASTATCGTGWLIVSQQSITAPGTLGVSVNTTGLQLGTCTGEVDISAPGVSSAPIVVPVSLLVTNLPLLIVPSPGPTFTYQPSTGALTPVSPQSVQITSSSSVVNFGVSVTGSPNFLQVTPLTGLTPQSLALTINPATLAGLAPGTYVNNVQVSSSGAANTPSFPVTLVVSNTAALASIPPSLTFNYQIGQPFSATQVLTINSTGAPLNFTVAANSSTCPGFLSATAFNGMTGFTFGSQNQVTVAVNVTGLTGTPPTCTGNLTFTVPGSSASPLAVPVTLNVSTGPLLNVGVPSISFTALAGSTTGTTQMVSLTSTGVALQFNAFATTVPAGLTWLSVTPNSGLTPTSLQVSINPTGLAVGTYPGTITVQNPPGATNAYPTQTIPVTLIIASANVTVTPASLTFNQAVGGLAPPFQTLQVTGVPAGTTIAANTTLLNGTGWLTTNVAGSTVTVTANGSALPQGTYNGVVTVIVPGAVNNPFNIPVTLVVGVAQSLSLSATTVNFSAQVGAAAPASQSVQLSSSGSAVPFTATFVAGTNTPSTLVTVTPASGLTPNTLVLALNPTVLATLPAGTYSGNVNVSSTAIPGGDQAIKVNITVAVAPPPIIVSVVNGASFAPGSVSPGEIISIFGSSMGPTPGLGFTPLNGKIDVNLAGTQVLFDNVPAPLIFVSFGQINAIVPYEVASLLNTGIGTKVTVIRGGVPSSQFAVGVTATDPAIFSSLQTGNGQGAILNQNLSANSVSNPAVRGTFISIYATGEGSLTPFVPTGTISGPSLPLPKPIATPVTVTIGGQPATVTYAGEAPSLVSGVLQVNAMVPTSIGPGQQQVVLTIGTNANIQQVINVAVQ